MTYMVLCNDFYWKVCWRKIYYTTSFNVIFYTLLTQRLNEQMLCIVYVAGFSEFTPNYTIENGMFIGVKICSVINLSNQNAQKEFLFNWTYLLLFNTCCFTIEPLLGVLFYLLFFVISTYSIRHVSSRSFWLRKIFLAKLQKDNKKLVFELNIKWMFNFSFCLKYNR